jgi:hypothetical protein
MRIPLQMAGCLSDSEKDNTCEESDHHAAPMALLVPEGGATYSQSLPVDDMQARASSLRPASFQV